MAIGSLHLEFKKCGKPMCCCRRGLLHGPYLYRHWREGGRQRKAYIPMKLSDEVLLEIEDQRSTATCPNSIGKLHIASRCQVVLQPGGRGIHVECQKPGKSDPAGARATRKSLAENRLCHHPRGIPCCTYMSASLAIQKGMRRSSRSNRLTCTATCAFGPE
jgi:Family of unknown function (DUF6788)